jgi:AraC-like DNA-binding protein
LPELAARLGLNYATFRRRFRREVGLSPAQYQLRRRMENARILLRTLTVQETAERLGYADPFVFSRQFRKSMGRAPSAWRAAS